MCTRIMTVEDIRSYRRSINIKGRVEIVEEHIAGGVVVLVKLSLGNLLRFRKMGKLLKQRFPLSIVVTIGFYLGRKGL